MTIKNPTFAIYTILIIVVVAIFGVGMYLFLIDHSEMPNRINSSTEITLTPEQSAEKSSMISELAERPVETLSPTDSSRKVALLEAQQNQ